MIATLLQRIFGTANERAVRRLLPLVDKINALEPRIQALSDEDLAQQTVRLRKRYTDGETLEQLLPEAFATVREAARRKLGQRHYDVQLMGGIVLHQGKISEMKTGEGKTLTATLPLYLNAIPGTSSILVTVNDYLAKRDAEWMRPVYEFLGMKVGYLQNAMDDEERRAVYQSDIVYGTNSELGFDYLRDNMKFRFEDFVQRDQTYCIVDEVDSILIDEARTPLIISGAAEDSSELYVKVNAVVAKLRKERDFEIDERDRHVTLTEAGTDAIEAALGIENLYDPQHIRLLHHANQALRAHALFKRDVDYVVFGDDLLIVDEFTGRIMPGRRYSDGLHQALEAKEGVGVKSENHTLASITLQNYFRLYKKLAGMTGTAATEAEEFYKIYKLEVVTVPTNRPVARLDKPDLIFFNESAKFKAIVDDIKERHSRGQPILVGTAAVETSERLSAELHKAFVPHEVLNAKQHEREAEIVAHAGEVGRVTIATNMAGRGTDIKLTPDSLALGGLYIIGTERHESRRIDNQLRGRAGRQGDPGESRFYLSLEDSVIRRFSGDSLKNILSMLGMKEDEVIEDARVSRAIDTAQEKVEKQHFEIRRQLIEYDDILNAQRKVFYSLRTTILRGGSDLTGLIEDIVAGCVENLVARYTTGRSLTSEQRDEILTIIAQLTGMPVNTMIEQGLTSVQREQLTSDIINFLVKQYTLRTQPASDTALNDEERTAIQGMFEQTQRWVLLENVDATWRQQMIDLETLREGIGLRGYGQKTPLVEYKREAFSLFQEVMRHLYWEVLNQLFRYDIRSIDIKRIVERRQRELDAIEQAHQHAAENADQDTSSQPVRKRKK